MQVHDILLGVTSEGDRWCLNVTSAAVGNMHNSVLERDTNPLNNAALGCRLC